MLTVRVWKNIFVSKKKGFEKLRNLTFAIHCYETFFLYIVGENSPLLYKRITYTMYAVGENSPMTWT